MFSERFLFWRIFEVLSFLTPSCFNNGAQRVQTDNLSNITNKSFSNTVQMFITFCWMDSVALVGWGGAHTRSSHQVVTKARVAKCHKLDIYTLKLTILLDFERIIDLLHCHPMNIANLLALSGLSYKVSYPFCKNCIQLT